jgi:hypothetical protein
MSVSTTSTVLGIDPVRSLGFGGITGAYAPIGASSEYEGRMLLIQNWTNGDLMFSDDGVNDKFPLKAGDKVVLDFSSNQTYERGLFWPIGTTLYVSYLTEPTSGFVYYTIFYGN